MIAVHFFYIRQFQVPTTYLLMVFANGHRGAFILFEGCDRAGKSTQCAMLIEHLRKTKGLDAQLLNFPDRTTAIGSTINSYLANASTLDDCAVHLLFSANRWEAMHNMEKLLTEGVTLVVDRYAFSGVAFSAAKGLSYKWCRSPDVGLLRPDITFFLDLPIEDAAKRGGFGLERYEKLEFQEKVRKCFLEIQEPDWNIMDARENIGVVHDKIKRIVDEQLATITVQDIRKDLWVEENE